MEAFHIGRRAPPPGRLSADSPDGPWSGDRGQSRASRATPGSLVAALPAWRCTPPSSDSPPRGDSDIVDITDRVQAAVADSGRGEGQASAFVRGSTAAITTMEYEPGGVHDLQALLERLVPAAGDYEHNRLNHDSNSHAHQRASIVGPSEVVPVTAAGSRSAPGSNSS